MSTHNPSTPDSPADPAASSGDRTSGVGPLPSEPRASEVDSPDLPSPAAATGAERSGQLPGEDVFTSDHTQAIDDASIRDERARRFSRQPSPLTTTDLAGATDSPTPTEPATTAVAASQASADSADEERKDRTQVIPTSAAGTAAETSPDTPDTAATRALSRDFDSEVVASIPQSGDANKTVSRPDLFAGLEDMPSSRAAAHWWVILVTLLLAPLAWFLTNEGGKNLDIALSSAADGLSPNWVGGALTLLGGLIALALLILAARWSSVGPIILGSILTIFGVAYLALPDQLAPVVDGLRQSLSRLGNFGESVWEHFYVDASWGRFAIYGVAFIMIGVVSHGARRLGRREERRRIALEL